MGAMASELWAIYMLRLMLPQHDQIGTHAFASGGTAPSSSHTDVLPTTVLVWQVQLAGSRQHHAVVHRPEAMVCQDAYISPAKPSMT